MPINEKTGRALRKKMSASELFAYRLRQQAIRKGKQPARGPPQRDAGAGSGASPAAMLSAPELESGSSYPPPKLQSALASQVPGNQDFALRSLRSARQFVGEPPMLLPPPQLLSPPLPLPLPILLPLLPLPPSSSRSAPLSPLTHSPVLMLPPPPPSLLLLSRLSLLTLRLLLPPPLLPPPPTHPLQLH